MKTIKKMMLVLACMACTIGAEAHVAESTIFYGNGHGHAKHRHYKKHKEIAGKKLRRKQYHQHLHTYYGHSERF